ncbi:MAG: leucine-rich repeat domain-containing protein [Clostridia bacterium]|nr:leucine-rich repeat domain-containing protein [Clostridia bacterium]
MKQTKRFFTVLLAVLFLVLTVPFAFAEPIDSGTCGDDLTWILGEDGTLTISGSGEMDSWADTDEVPWADYVSVITAVVIESGVTSIGDGAFVTCDSMEEIAFPDTLESIGSAFAYCSALQTVEIPDGVTEIADSAFMACTGITEFKVSPYNYIFCSDDAGVLYNKEKTNLIQYPLGREETSFAIPDTVNTVSQSAFTGSNLTEITIPTGVLYINEGAFDGCEALKDVYYAGTQAQWEAVLSYNDPFANIMEYGLQMHFSEDTEPQTDPTDGTTSEPATEPTQTDAPTDTQPAAPSATEKATEGTEKKEAKEKKNLLPVIFIAVVAVLILAIVIVLALLLKKDKTQPPKDPPADHSLDETIAPPQARPAQPQNRQGYPPQNPNQYR